ncbi:MAG: hypothetical protein WC789_06930 [Lentisphaeria bacterium]
MTDQQKKARQEVQENIGRSALASPEKLKAWLAASRRSFVVFDSLHLADSLPWPDGVREFTALVDRYRQHRERALPPRPKEGEDLLGHPSVGMVCMTDVLEPEELDRLVHWAASLLLEVDPGWTFERGMSAQYQEKQHRLREAVEKLQGA